MGPMGPTLTVTEAAERAGVSVKTIRRWVKAEKLHVGRDGTGPKAALLIDPDELDTITGAAAPTPPAAASPAAPTDTPRPPRPMPRTEMRSVTQAIREGTNRDVLAMIRRSMASIVDDPDAYPRDRIAASKSLIDVDERIRTLDEQAAAAEEVDSDAATADEEWAPI